MTQPMNQMPGSNPGGQTPGKPLEQQPPGDNREPGTNPTHPDRAPQTRPADHRPGENPAVPPL